MQAAKAFGHAPSRWKEATFVVTGTYRGATNAEIVALGRLFESGEMTKNLMWGIHRGRCGREAGSFVPKYKVHPATMDRLVLQACVYLRLCKAFTRHVRHSTTLPMQHLAVFVRNTF